MIPIIVYGAGALLGGLGLFGRFKPIHMKFRAGDTVLGNSALCKAFTPSTGNDIVFRAMQNPEFQVQPGIITVKNTQRFGDAIIGTAFFADNLKGGFFSSPSFEALEEAAKILQDQFLKVVVPNNAILQLRRGLDNHEVKWSMFETLS